MSMIKIALAQLNFTVGDLQNNTQKIIDECALYKHKADVIVFSELAVCGYPPEDLLLRGHFMARVNQCVDAIEHALDNWDEDLTIVLGAPFELDNKLFNGAVTLNKNQHRISYKKQRLPNYGVFDEKRYFSVGEQTQLVNIHGFQCALSVCEDLWSERVAEQAKKAGADIVLNLNASPYHIGKHQQRIDAIKQRANETGLPIVYVNQVGGQDELLFDGHSFAVDGRGDVVFQAGQKPQTSIISIDRQGNIESPNSNAAIKTQIAQLYDALVCATKDYVLKNGFKGALLGLSGGIDSALVLAIAADALGAEAMHAVMMPYHYTAEMSVSDAELEAKTLGVEFSNIAIHPPVNAFLEVLKEQFEGHEKDSTEENIQARTRAVILMALSNKTGKMLLTTGNKSEMSVGYATLYGDMAGGFAPLKDVSKLRVFELSRYRNTLSAVIPERVITRPPSAELSPDQVDSDSLPPYAVLDAILEAYIEQQLSSEEIIARGYSKEDVARVTRLVDINEYKRRQAPPGVKVTARAFGKERRYPMTSRFKG